MPVAVRSCLKIGKGVSTGDFGLGQFVRQRLLSVLDPQFWHPVHPVSISCRDRHGGIGQDKQDLQDKILWQSFGAILGRHVRVLFLNSSRPAPKSRSSPISMPVALATRMPSFTASSLDGVAGTDALFRDFLRIRQGVGVLCQNCLNQTEQRRISWACDRIQTKSISSRLQRCGQPGQQHGLRIPLRILSRPTSMRRFRVSSFLADVTQHIHSFRAIGVIAAQRLLAAASDTMAVRKSAGSL